MEISSMTASGGWQQQSTFAKRMIAMLAVVGLLAAAVIGYQVFIGTAQQQAVRARTGQPQTVSATPAELQAWTPRIASVGTLRAVNGAGARFNMGLVIPSGVTIGTLFTLFVVPAVYLLLAANHSKKRLSKELGLAEGRESASPAK